MYNFIVKTNCFNFTFFNDFLFKSKLIHLTLEIINL